MNRLTIRLIFVLGTITFCFLGLQKSIEFGGFQQFESQLGMIPEQWSAQELNKLSALSKVILLLVLSFFTVLGYRLTKRFKIESFYNALFDFLGISIAFAFLAAFFIKLVPFDLFTITSTHPNWNPSFYKILGSIIHLSILSFFLGTTIFLLEEGTTKRSSISHLKFKGASIWISFFLVYAFMNLILMVALSGIVNTRWISILAFQNIIQVIIFSICCTICSWSFFFIFPTMPSLRSIKNWILFLVFSYGLYGYIFLLYVISNAFDFIRIGGFVRFDQWFTLLFFDLVVVLICSLVRRFNWFGFKNAIDLSEISAELSNLKSQINPHFLFNSLNSLYGLALEESSPKTSTGIQKLSEMMRFMLRENVEDTIEISREFEYVENYIELQKLRVEGNEKVRLEYEIDKACEGEITPMLLIPFIENAFKHGVSAHHNSWIEIKLSCSKEAIHLNVKNSNHKKLKSTEEESGIGLENVRQRLAMLYPGKHLFQLFENEESFEANLKIEVN
ncbi:sensor histidine kinase [Roseivirga thermotolerans]|uniref:sensor histidine kinase n=1 Tax=Roseivirga thermotolerans TaxID=1758176 RepID=UPI0027400299|nr:histidine kinase [Roseivirga thermotolerans]